MVDKSEKPLVIKVSIDQAKPKILSAKASMSLSEVRTKLGSSIDDSTKFLNLQGEPIKVEDEQSILLQQILTSNTIYLSTVEQQGTSVKIFANGIQVTSINISEESSLSQLREALLKQAKIHNGNFIFIYDGCEIPKEEENDIEIQGITQERKLEISFSAAATEEQPVQIITQQPHPPREYDEEQEKPIAFGETINVKQQEEDLMIEHEASSEMPHCAEKVLKECIFVAKSPQSKYDLPKSIEELQYYLKEKVQSLYQQIEVEDLMTKKCQELREEIDSQIKTKDWTELGKTLVLIMKEILIVDVQKFRTALEKVEEESGRTSKKDVILFLGDTGAGKSTTIHFLAGSKMVQTKINGKIYHIGPSEINNEQAKQIYTSPFAFSVTKLIAPVQLVTPNIVLADTPGFGDTQGVEIDVANGIGIVKALQKCKSVRLVLVISAKSQGDRWTGVKKLARQLCGMIRNIGDYKEVINYVFTKYDQKDQEGIHQVLSNYVQNMDEDDKSDEAFVSIMEDLVYKTDVEEHIFLDPLRNNPKKILHQLNKSQKITDPSTAFQVFLTKESQDAMHNQVLQHQKAISTAMERKDYALIIYKLQEIKFLDEVLEKDFIKNIYEQCIAHLIRYNNSAIDGYANSFIKCFAMDNAITIEDIQQFKNGIEEAKKIRDLKDQFLGEEARGQEFLEQQIVSRVQYLIDRIAASKYDSDIVKKCLDKIKVLSLEFTYLQELYQSSLQKIYQDLKQDIYKFVECYTSKQHHQTAEIFATISTALKNLSDHLNEGISQQLDQAINDFLQHLKQNIEGLGNSFAPEGSQQQLIQQQEERASTEGNDSQESKTLSQDFPQIKVIQEEILSLEKFKAAFTELGLPSIKKNLNDIYEMALTDVIVKVNQIMAQINEASQQPKEEEFFSSIKDNVLLIKNLRDCVPEIEIRTSKVYFSTIEIIFGKIKEVRMYIENRLESIVNIENYDQTFKNNQMNKYQQLSEQLNIVLKAKWLDLIRPDTCKVTLKSFKSKIKEHAVRLQNYALQKKIDLDNYANIQQFANLQQEINQLKVFKIVDDELEAIAEQISKRYSDQIQATFEKINIILNDFKEQSFDQQTEQVIEFINPEKIEKSLQFLTVTKELISQSQDDQIVKDKEKASELYEKFDETIVTWNKTSFKFLIDNLTKIQQFEREDKSLLVTLSNNLDVVIQEVLQIDKVTVIYKQKFNQVKDIKTELNVLLMQLSEDLRSEIDIYLTSEASLNIINTKLLIAKTLYKLDAYHEGEKFKDLYKEYSMKYYKMKPQEQNKIQELIKEYKFQEAQSELLNLQLQDDKTSQLQLQHLMNRLKTVANDLIQETLELARRTQFKAHIRDGKIHQMVRSLKRIKDLTHLEQFIGTHNEEFEKIKKIACLNYKKQLTKISEQIVTHHFLEASKDFEKLQEEYLDFHDFCDDEIFGIIQEMEELEAQQLRQIKDHYQNQDIKELSQNPPKDILSKLYEGQQRQVYNQVISEIESIILKKFRDELKKISQMQHPNAQKLQLQFIDIWLPCLTDKLINQVTNEMTLVQNEMHLKNEKNNLFLNDAIESKNLPFLEERLQEFRSTNNYVEENKIKKFYKDEVQLYCNKIEEQFKTGLDSELVDYFQNVFGLITSIRKVCKNEEFPSFKMISQKFRTLLKECLQNAQDLLIPLINGDASYVDSESGENKYSHKNLEILVRIRIYLSGDEFEIIQIFDKEYPPMMTRLIESIIKIQTNFENNLSALNFVAIEKYLKNFNQFDMISTKVYNDLRDISGNQLNEIDTYDQLIKLKDKMKVPYNSYELLIQKINPLKESLQFKCQQGLINDKTKYIELQRDEYFQQLNDELKVFASAEKIQKYVEDQININDFLNDFYTQFNNQLQEIEEDLNQKINNLDLSQDEGYRCNIMYKILTSYQQNVDKQFKKKEIKPEEIRQKVIEKVKVIKDKSTSASIEPNKLGQNIVNLKNLNAIVDELKGEIDSKIDEILYDFTKKQKNAGLSKLSLFLEDSATGKEILSEHKIFRQYNISIFNQKTNKLGIDYVLSNMEGDNLDLKYLILQFQIFNQEYQKIIKKFVKQQDVSTDEKINQIIEKIKLKLGIKEEDIKNWRGLFKQNLVHIIAMVFAIYTMINAESFVSHDNGGDQEAYLFCPHPAQVISVFRILGMGVSGQIKLQNNLVQIGTGEGKSITLAVTSSVLALLGFEVNCACYSRYLSERDYRDFEKLFSVLGIDNAIRYGTFNQLCEIYINKQIDIRKVIQKLFFGESIDDERAKAKTQKLQVLLIDEVDVFFSKEFYGNLYSPQVSIKHETITDLIKMIWNNRENQLKLRDVQNTEEYQQVIDEFSQWKGLIDEAIKDMLADLKEYRSQDYVVDEKVDKIGYKEQDNIVYNISYGYKTMFAYFWENYQNKISDASLQNNICLGFNCGSFSFAEIPQQFTYIMGVSGTLKTLSQKEKDLVKSQYNVQIHTYMPSVFGVNQLNYDQKNDVIICNEHDYYNRIATEIKSRIATKRAVLVFFENKKDLYKFFESPNFNILRNDKINILTEEANKQEKESFIKQATLQSHLTLFTRSFGRGTDFIQRDEFVKNLGGTHVIQTFFSEELSEETQIKGRTARQGDVGSYQMILLDKDLEKFNVFKEDIDREGKMIYELLNENRAKQFNNYYQTCIKSAETVKKPHKESEQFVESVVAGDEDKMIQYMIKFNQGAEEEQLASRTIVCMDATGSMHALLENSKNCVHTMFERAQNILAEHGISQDCFQVMFAAYRNYSSLEDILQQSAWTYKPAELKQFLAGVKASGGMGNEAIEVGLWHALEEHKREPINQVIVIGDVPPNTPEEIEQRRKQCDEAFWETSKFKDVKYYKEHVNEFVANNIPIHAFYVNENAQDIFQEIANATNGRCDPLDIQSDRGSEMLTDLVTEEILRNISQNKGLGDKLVDSYKKQYKDSE